MVGGQCAWRRRAGGESARTLLRGPEATQRAETVYCRNTEFWDHGAEQNVWLGSGGKQRDGTGWEVFLKF